MKNRRIRYYTPKYLILLLEFFHYDISKVNLWLNTPNPHLGNTTPNEMIAVGREKVVKKFVLSALAGNRP